jgi:apolipoprotein N-acyltransferase
MNRIGAILAALVASAAMFWFGTGLDPVWWVTWLAPLPLLWLAPRMPGTWAFALAILAWLAGALNEWSYARADIGLPIPVVLAIVALPALAFGTAVLLWRRLLLRGALLQAPLAFSGVIVALGFALQRLSPHSTWGSLAYTQMDCLPVLQSAALAGVSGIVFLVTFLPSALASAVLGNASLRYRVLVASCAITLVVVAVGWGAWRLSSPSGPQIKVGLIASDLTENLFPRGPQKKQQLLAAYAARAASLIAQGAQLVIAPEKIVRVQDVGLAELDLPFQRAAALGAVIAVGVERWSGADKLNESRIYGPPGTLWVTYEKHHMLPAFESDLKVGTARTVLNQPSGKWGVAICKDLDFPALSREYGNDGIGLLIVSAWDFVTDAWLHDRMAVMRGVESGFSLARAAKRGLLTLSDDRGRVVAQARTGGEAFSSLLGKVPVHHQDTLYVRWGDWFSWLVLLMLMVVSFNAIRPVRV